MSCAPKVILNWDLYWIEWFYGYSFFLMQFLYEFWLYHSCAHSLHDMALYKVLPFSGGFWVFLTTFGLQPYRMFQIKFVSNLIFIWNSALFSFLIELIDNVLFLFTPDPDFPRRKYWESYVSQTHVGMVLPEVLRNRCLW
jgi:hypothetical protein